MQKGIEKDELIAKMISEYDVTKEKASADIDIFINKLKDANVLNNKEIQLEDVIQIIKEKLNSGGTVTFTPHGTSMYPMLRNGEDVVVLKSRRVG